MSESDYRAALWRYTEVSNALMAISLGATGVKLADSAISYLYKSDYSFKPVSSKLTTVERMGVNVAKALQEAPEMPKHLGVREATFTLSTQWKPTGYFFRGPDIVSWAPGTSYSSRINVTVRFEVVQYTITLEGKKDKDKDKDKSPPIDYKKLSAAITTGVKNASAEDMGEGSSVIKLEAEGQPKEKDKKPPITVTILENASMAMGEGKPRQLGWGTKLNLTGEIFVGRDGDDLGTIFYEFKITWSESCTSATFTDTISIKCYHSGQVVVSPSFYEACDTAEEVKQKLSVDADAYKIAHEVWAEDDVPEFKLDDHVDLVSLDDYTDLLPPSRKKDKSLLILSDDDDPIRLKDDESILLKDDSESSDEDDEFTLIPSTETGRPSETIKRDQSGERGESSKANERTPLVKDKDK